MNVNIAPCYDKKCLIVVCRQAIPLSNTCATLVHTTEQLIVPAGFGLEIKNHFFSKSWRIANRYCFPDQKSFTMAILATRPCILQAGQVLCHLQCTPLENIFQQIIGDK